MLEDVIERRFLVDRVVPAHRLVEHHEEEAVEGLGEEHLEAIVGFHHKQNSLWSAGSAGENTRGYRRAGCGNAVRLPAATSSISG
jgi:hypothetical protein